MNMTNDKPIILKRYLLGELSTAEMDALEDEYFLDKEKFEQLRRIEDDLLDDYSRGRLSPSDLKCFESHYLTNPRRRSHAQFAKAFTHIIDNLSYTKSVDQKENEKPLNVGKGNLVLQWVQRISLLGNVRAGILIASSIIILLLSGSIVWLLIDTSRLTEQVGKTQRDIDLQKQQIQSQNRRSADLEQQNQKLSEENKRLQDSLLSLNNVREGQSSPSPLTVPYELTINSFRNFGERESQPLIIEHNTKQVRFRIDITEYEFVSYQISLHTSDSKEVFIAKGLRPQITKKRSMLILDVQSYLLESGSNILTVQGITTLGELELLGKALIRVRKQ